MPCQVYTHRYFVLDGHRQQRWRIDLEIGEGGRNGPGDMRLAALFFHFERHLSVMGSLASELNFKVGVDARCRGIRFRQASTHSDQRKLRTARDLNHVEVAVAVPRIKRLNWYRDQKLALPAMADALALRPMAHTFRLVQWVGHMVGESALLEDPLGIRFSKRGERHER